MESKTSNLYLKTMGATNIPVTCKRMVRVAVLCFVTTSFSQNITFPDPNFESALVNTLCASVTEPCLAESDVDYNNNGTIQISEAEFTFNLCLVDLDIASLEGIENFTNLQTLTCVFNDLKNLDISAITGIRELNCESNSLTNINLDANLNLRKLIVNNNPLKSLDVSLLSELEILDAIAIGLGQLDISHNTELKMLGCGYNNLNVIDITNNSVLEKIFIANNNISKIDVSNNHGLLQMNLDNNPISQVDVSNLPSLEVISLRNTIISSLDLSNNTHLTSVAVANTPLQGIFDFSTHPNLNTVLFNNTNISGLDMRNRNNDVFIIRVKDTPNLNCVAVDDPSVIDPFEFPYSEWEYDDNMVFSTDCSLGVQKQALADIVLYPNPVKDKLFVKNTTHAINLVKIYTVEGKLVIEERLLNAIDLSSLNTGKYLAKVETDSGTAIRKFIKE
ncbi:MAG: T9SS type A sorting domain-containing protein [Marinirhabdus sp.]